MVQPFIAKKQGHDVLFWNIDANVGLASPNKPEDVELVQFGYFAAAQNPQTRPENKPIFGAVVPGAKYSGDPNDPLTKAIIAHQKSRGGTQDGHVSVIRGAGAYSPTHTFMLIALVNNLFDLSPRDYPRLDRIPSCPPLLRTAVARCFNLG